MMAMLNASQPSVSRKVAEMVMVRKNSAVLTVPMVVRGCGALDHQVGGDDRSPAAAAGRVEEAADQPERRDDAWRLEHMSGGSSRARRGRGRAAIR
jgi:hypothetical protein